MSRRPAASGLSPLQRSAFSIAIGLAFASGSVLAQTEEKKPAKDGAVELGTVKVEAAAEVPYKADTVSSPKFTQPLVDTPQTIVVLKKELMAEQGATSLTDALRATPGITLQMGENGNSASGDAISMRGTDAQNSIFLDNVRDLGGASRDVFNIEQIEISKGPSGADNGRGSAAGYINLASKVPSIGNAYSGTVSYGTNERRRVTADLNQTIGEHTAIRLNLLDQGGGVAGRDVIERKTVAVAPSIGLGLGTETRIYIYSQHVRQDNTPDGGVSAFAIPGYVQPGTPTPTAANPNPEPTGNARFFAPYTSLVPEPVDSSNFYGFTSDYDKNSADMITARFEHDLAPGITVRNLSRYGKNEQKRVLTGVNAVTIPTYDDDNDPATAAVMQPDTSQWTVSRSRQAVFRNTQVLTNQTNLTANFKTGFVSHSLSSGAEAIYERVYAPAYVFTGTSTSSASLYNPDPRQPADRSTAPNGAYTEAETVTTALYAFDTLKFGERWLLNGGLRWERYEIDTDAVTLAGTQSATQPLPTGTPIPSRLGAADTLLSWKAGLTFKPTESGSIYLAFANQLQPPGSDLIANNATSVPLSSSGANVNSPNLDPRRSINIELGAKWNLFDDKLLATAALFRTTVKNDQATSDPTDSTIVFQFGKRQVQGVELGLVGQITEAWQVQGGVTFQDSEIKEGSYTIPAGQSFDPSQSAQNGQALAVTPKMNATLWTNYKLPFKLTVGGGLRYVDSQTRSNPGNANVQTGVFEIASYTVFDGFLSYPITKSINAQLNVYNLTDEFYTSTLNSGGSRYIPGTPRSYWLTLNARF